MKRSTTVVLNLLAFLPFCAFAGIVVDPYDTTVEVGEWCGNYPAARNYAEAHNLPLVIIWSKDNCDHCTALSDALAVQAGLTWAASQNAVFCYVKGYDAGGGNFTDYSPNQGAVEFVGGESGDFDYLSHTPFVRLYWKDHGSARFTGRSGMMYSTTGSTLLAQFENSVEQFISDYSSFDPPVPSGDALSGFPFGNSLCDRLEIVKIVTPYVDIPVVRTNNLNRSETVQIKCEYIDGETGEPLEYWGRETISVTFAVGKTIAFGRYTVPGETEDDFVPGDCVNVSLLDGNGATTATRTIAILDADDAELENSPKNPYWLGERTANSLQWGEWTMDLGIVTNKVKSWNKAHPNDRAYAMMFVGGSTWCPDCAMAEANVFSNSKFKTWAAEHKVVFGVLDIPSNPQATEAFPSQLRYESYRTSDAYVTLRGSATADETQRYQSGAGYLSRHSVPYADALDVSARNAFLMGHDTLHGGWNRPERENKNRTGVPVLLLLRDDGTIAARWNRFSDVGPAAYSDGYLRRFEEMLAQVGATEEEANDNKLTTGQTIVVGGASVSAAVSTVDQADVYRISEPVANATVKFTVTGDAKMLTASIIDGGTGTELASASGLASAGFSVSVKFESAAPCYLKIAPQDIADGSAFGYTNGTSTVCNYAVQATSRLSGGDFGFAVAVTNVMEDCGTVTLAVSRTNGSGGAATVRVGLRESQGEDVSNRIVWPNGGVTLSWASGEMGVKTAVLTVKPDGKEQGDLRLVFELADLTDAETDDVKIVSGTQVVNVYDVDASGRTAYCHVVCTDARTIDGYRPGDEVRISCTSGRLPEGFEVVADGNRIVAGGYAADQAGRYLATYAVSLVRGGNVVSTQTMDFDFTVIDYDFSGDIPSLVALRTYGNLPLIDESDGSLQGLLTVTVPPDGRLSAKFTTDGQTFAYSAAGWDAFDRPGGMLTAVLKPTSDGVQAMHVVFTAERGVVTFVDPVGGGDLVFELRTDIWPKGAAAWAGQYTVQMPQTNATDGSGTDRLGGAAYLALRMVSAEAIAEGSMLYAGVLPNGRAVYGTSVLMTNETGEAILPFYHTSDMKSAPYSFSGGLTIVRNAASEYKTFRWSVSEAWTPVWSVPDALGHASEFNVFGAYYDRDEIAERFAEDFSGELDNFAFVAATESIARGRYGTTVGMAPVLAEVTSEDVPKLVDATGNPQEVELEFSPETGVIRGSFYLPLASGGELPVTYRGIVLPGWQGCSSCSRSGSYVERPWADGACSFSDRVSAGACRNGCEVKLDRYR